MSVKSSMTAQGDRECTELYVLEGSLSRERTGVKTWGEIKMG